MIELRGVTKRYDDKTAVDGIELDIPAGGVFGLIGPNGAGKTTALKMLSTLIKPDEGTITVDGLDIVDDRRLLPNVVVETAVDHRRSVDAHRTNRASLVARIRARAETEREETAAQSKPPDILEVSRRRRHAAKPSVPSTTRLDAIRALNPRPDATDVANCLCVKSPRIKTAVLARRT
jgi:ABC-type multidrug transport system ATPase subunit